MDFVDNTPLVSAFSYGIFSHYHENFEYSSRTVPDASAMTEEGRSALDVSTGSGYPDSKKAVLLASWRQHKSQDQQGALSSGGVGRHCLLRFTFLHYI